MLSTHMLLASQSREFLGCYSQVIVKYMDIISTVLSRHTTNNLIVTDGPCLLGTTSSEEIKGEDSMYTPMCVATYIATWIYSS